jgi:NAD(P)-dependent dehydrogenase (short-subunit alcohol dehydrogenase family)
MLKGQIAVVTGASRGIGYELALKLAAHGAHIVAVARTQGGLEALDDKIKELGGSATLVPMDLKDYAAIDRLGGSLYDRYGKLDIFVGNGAILGPISPIAHIEPKMWDDTIATNITANYRLIRSFDSLLKAAPAARVAFMSSAAAWKGTAYWGLYGATKAAIDALTRAYASETIDTAIRVNAFNPGPIRTKMRAQAMPGENPLTLDTAEQAAAELLSLCLPSCISHGMIFDYPSKQFLRYRAPS